MEWSIVRDEEEWSRASALAREGLLRFRTRLETDPFAVGDRIQRTLFPRKFRDAPNLFRLALPDGWRALYVVHTKPPGEGRVEIVFIGDHKRYERLFGYRR
ncbi:MAG TPA: hypothetical protein VGR28_08900 [Candidatus Thermoplasmatota archaeon]|jgi:hypothetical protein|nr:hypothetical protein [Candidatus Thermoplasmatota archaeon]